MSTFQRCDESVNKMAVELLKEFEAYLPLLAAKVKIDFVFAYAPLDNDGFPKGCALKLHGVKVDGICRIISKKQRALGRGDAEISLDGDYWREATREQRRALLDHELHHLMVKLVKGLPGRDDLGRPLLKLRTHDVEIGWFAIIAERHGAASGEMDQARKIMMAYGQYFWPELLADKQLL